MVIRPQACKSLWLRGWRRSPRSMKPLENFDDGDEDTESEDNVNQGNVEVKHGGGRVSDLNRLFPCSSDGRGLASP